MQGNHIEHLQGEVERITFHSEDSGFAVLRVRIKGKKQDIVTVTGRVPAVQVGEEIEASGGWIEDRNFGQQFKAESLRLSAPQSEGGVIRFLGSGMFDGIGPKLAEKIVGKFGIGVFDLMDSESKKLEEVEGIGPKKRKEIKASWDQQRSLRDIMLFLHSHGISSSRAMRIYKAYGEQAREVLERNPYQLAEDIFGIGFKTADSLAAQLGMAPDSPQRRAAAMLHVMRSAREEGNAALPREDVIHRTATLLEADIATIDEVLPVLITQGHLIEDKIDDIESVYLPALRMNELSIAKCLAKLRGKMPLLSGDALEKAVAKAEGKAQFELADGQRAAVRMALLERVAVITGGPGVGKTTVLRTILSVLDALHLHSVLAAPTGRAAKRLSESGGREALTLHRMLQYQPGTGFNRNRRNPLAGDVFVIDEVSMVDLPLMAAFLEALPESARLLLVGDADQLPSVGPGTVLADIIASKALPVARLTEIFRQAASSKIVTAAHAINQGILPDLPPIKETDCMFLPRADCDQTMETLLHLVRDRLPQGLGVDAMDDIQVLSPMNRGGVGTAELNRRLQDALNPSNEFKAEIERYGSIFRRGDKILQTRNNYDKNVFNGDIGRIVDIEFDPNRVWIRFDDGKVVDYDPNELDEIRHAFAITIHKSQGSEFPVVVLPLTTGHFMLLQRNLLYTGLTRGKRLVVLVGEEKALRMAVQRQETNKRWGGLRQRLLKMGG